MGPKILLYRKGLDSEKRISSLGPIVDALPPPMLFVYRLASATLTAEEKSVHQKRKSRAYQWKRPTVFLEEGGSLPPDIDPDTTRWIQPITHWQQLQVILMRTLAQTNIYETDGVPSGVKAQHEAMQKKLQAFRSEQRLNEAAVNLDSFDFERPLNSLKPREQRTSQ